jgi:hypothetical protein
MTFAWHWQSNPSPPPAQGAVATGAARQRLLERLRQQDEPTLGQLQLSWRADLLVLVAPSTAWLPWVEDVQYISPAIDGLLWLPTHQQPSIPPDVLAQALLKQYQRSPLLLLARPQWVIPLDRLLPCDAQRLAQIGSR